MPKREGLATAVQPTNIKCIYTEDYNTLANICIMDFEADGLHLRFRQPLHLQPFYDESGSHLCVKHDPHSLFLFASSRNELIEDIKEHYAFLWEEYVLVDASELTPQALALAEALKRELEAV